MGFWVTEVETGPYTPHDYISGTSTHQMRSVSGPFSVFGFTDKVRRRKDYLIQDRSYFSK